MVFWIHILAETIATAMMIAAPAAAAVDTTDRYLIARLGALCFLLSTLEYMIPKPLPFLRIGLANIPIMLAITILPLRSFGLLVVIKLLGQALIGGTLFSWIFLFSVTGTLSSALVMYGLKKTFGTMISYLGLCVAGAFASNAAQLFLAKHLIFGESARLVAPPFIVTGILSGIVLGLFANRFAAGSRWFAAVQDGSLSIPVQKPDHEEINSRQGIVRIITATVLVIVLLFSRSLQVTAGITTLAFFLLVINKVPLRILPAIITAAGIVLFNLFVPFGRILAEPASFPVTEGALLMGIKKALVFEGMLFISRWAFHGNRSLPGFRSTVMKDLFGFLEILTNGRKKIDRKNIIKSIDALMFEHV